MNEIPTPRTDAAIVTVDVAFVGHDGLTSAPEDFVSPDFARTLEKELTALQQELAEANRRIDNQRDCLGCLLNAISPRPMAVLDAANYVTDLHKKLKESQQESSRAWGVVNGKVTVIAMMEGNQAALQQERDTLRQQLSEANDKIRQACVWLQQGSDVALAAQKVHEHLLLEAQQNTEARTQNDRLREALKLAQQKYRVANAINVDELHNLKTPYDEALSQP